MARLYSRKRGKAARSRKVYRESAPEWQGLKAKEAEEQVVKLGKEGLNSALIGNVLRDQYAVPDIKVATGKTIESILAENELSLKFPLDFTSLVRKAINLRSHLDNFPKDMDGKRGLQLTESKIRRLIKYYKRTGDIPVDWKYKPATAGLLVE